MPQIHIPLTMQFQTVKDGDIETVNLQPGDPITIIKEWTRFYLIRDAAGHFYNVPKGHVSP